MKAVRAYSRINKAIQAGYLEPAWGWGLRVAFSITIPLLWGVYTGLHEAAMWMAIAAECVSFIELKGAIGQRVRLLLAATALSVVFCFIGSFIGTYFWLSLIGMLAVGFLSGLFKNLGERGTGLAISVYIFYIITCAYPVTDISEISGRCWWVLIGGVWTTIVGFVSFLFIRSGTPYRRTVVGIWKSISELAHTSGKGWDGRSERSSIRDIYLKENEIRKAIDDSLALFGENLPAENVKLNKEYQLFSQTRKATALISLQVIQLSEILDFIGKEKINRRLSIQIFSLMRVVEQIGDRMAVFMILTKEEEKLLVLSRLERLKKISQLLKELSLSEEEDIRIQSERIALIANRINRLVQMILSLLEQPGRKRVYRSYSFTHTLHILHPQYFQNNIRQLLHKDSLTTKYALRVGVAAMIGWLLAKLVFTDHGYWIPFTAIVIAQPYFGATLKKGFQRSIGTIGGVIVGTLVLLLPHPEITRLIVVFISGIFLIYFIRREYSLASFFITLLLVGLLGTIDEVSTDLLLVRVVNTIIGSSLSVVTGFALFPTWDKKMLPEYLYKSLLTNFRYFQYTFYHEVEKQHTWTIWKQRAEVENSNCYDSLNRYMREPGAKKEKKHEKYFFLLTHNIRITRELNNYHNEIEADDDKIPIRDKEKFHQLLHECDDYFRENLEIFIKKFHLHIVDNAINDFPIHGFVNLTPNSNQYIFMEKMLIELKAIRYDEVIQIK